MQPIATAYMLPPLLLLAQLHLPGALRAAHYKAQRAPGLWLLQSTTATGANHCQGTSLLTSFAAS
jgi:hypothetical protein